MTQQEVRAINAEVAEQYTDYLEVDKLYDVRIKNDISKLTLYAIPRYVCIAYNKAVDFQTTKSLASKIITSEYSYKYLLKEAYKSTAQTKFAEIVNDIKNCIKEAEQLKLNKLIEEVNNI